jgi:hypothetical protein
MPQKLTVKFIFLSLSFANAFKNLLLSRLWNEEKLFYTKLNKCALGSFLGSGKFRQEY